jgi:hypothetical protein
MDYRQFSHSFLAIPQILTHRTAAFQFLLDSDNNFCEVFFDTMISTSLLITLAFAVNEALAFPCDLSNVILSPNPPNQTLFQNSSSPLKFVGSGFGNQKYICSPNGTYV